MKNILITLMISLFTASAFGGGSSTVGAIGPSARAGLAFDADRDVQTEIELLERDGYKRLQRFPEVEKVEEKNCRVPEGDNYVGGKATFTICDSVFSVERDFKKPGKTKIVKIQRMVEGTQQGYQVLKGK